MLCPNRNGVLASNRSRTTSNIAGRSTDTSSW